VFAPSLVHWWYGRNPAQPGTSMVWVLRALLTLPEPGDVLPLAPAPDGTGVPGTRTPVRIGRRLAT
jgi:hypothetical protein